MKIDVKSEIFFARNPIFTTPGPQNRTQGDFLKIGQPADDAAWQVGGTMAARPFKYSVQNFHKSSCIPHVQA